MSFARFGGVVNLVFANMAVRTGLDEKSAPDKLGKTPQSDSKV